MKLVEALNILKGVKRRKGELFTCFLATGSEPSSPQDILGCRAQSAFHEQKIEIQSGLYGDFLGNLDRLRRADAESGIVLMEWTDLDPRLGIRTAAAWSPSHVHRHPVEQ